MPAIPEWLRSTLITFAVTFALAVSASDFEWTQSAIVAALIAAGRTALSAVLPGGSFGTSPTIPVDPEAELDA